MKGIANIMGIDWEPEVDIYSEVGSYQARDGRLLDLVVTPLAAGGVEVDVIDGDTLAVREWRPTLASAKAAAIAAARRIAA